MEEFLKIGLPLINLPETDFMKMFMALLAAGLTLLCVVICDRREKYLVRNLALILTLAGVIAIVLTRPKASIEIYYISVITIGLCSLILFLVRVFAGFKEYGILPSSFGIICTAIAISQFQWKFPIELVFVFWFCYLIIAIVRLFPPRNSN